MKIAQKEIKNFPAVDITTWSKEKLAILPNVEEIAYSIGVYGCNGKLLHGTDGNTNLFKF